MRTIGWMVLGVGSGLALIGCDGGQLGVTTPAKEILAQRVVAGQSVTGHAEFINPRTGFRVSISGAAVRHADGSASGEFEQHVEVATTGEFVRRAHATVLCFTIVGNTARIGAVIDRAEGASAPPGTEIVGMLVDNGEGDDSPDLASPTAPGSATAYCASGVTPPLPLFPVLHGNIQVRS